MTTHENPYGLGYERATELGPDVEFKSYVGWVKRDKPYRPLGRLFIYRRPIKLRVGHRYVRRDGVVVRVLSRDNYTSFRCDDGRPRYENGRYVQRETINDLVTHIEEPETKEEPMTCLNVNNVVVMNNVPMTYAQIEAAHAEMMRQKADNEIKMGDIVKVKETGVIFLVTQIHETTKECSTSKISWYNAVNLEKVTGTPEFMAQLRAKLEGK